MSWFLAYLSAGAVIGFFAGLLGIGGGMTLVPILSALFAAQQLSTEHTMHLALGTSMAAIMFTGSASVREHQRLGSVDMAVVRRLAPAMALGTLASSFLAGWVPQREMAMVFAFIVAGASIQIALGRKPAAARGLPGRAGMWGVGLGIGVVSGLVSAGGAFMSVPFLLWCGVSARTAIGTGAALGIPVAVLGTLGYVGAGLGEPGLPQGSLGFVLLPALAGVVLSSILTAPVGARLAHRLQVATLRRLFAIVLMLLAAKMVWSYV